MGGGGALVGPNRHTPPPRISEISGFRGGRHRPRAFPLPAFSLSDALRRLAHGAAPAQACHPVHGRSPAPPRQPPSAVALLGGPWAVRGRYAWPPARGRAT